MCIILVLCGAFLKMYYTYYSCLTRYVYKPTEPILENHPYCQIGMVGHQITTGQAQILFKSTYNVGARYKAFSRFQLTVSIPHASPNPSE